MIYKEDSRDKQTPKTDKVENDTHRLCSTQLNQGERRPDSRSDQEADLGGSNQSQSRRDPVGHER